jgi:large subunit ribosomal protein L21
MLYAIIEQSGRQFWVQKDMIVWFDLMSDKKPGDTIEIDKVLLFRVDDEIKVGSPYVENAKVIAEVIEHAKGEKIRVFKYKPKKGYHKTIGHRQKYTVVKIKDLVIG